MQKLRAFLRTGKAKIIIAALCVAGALAAGFIMQPAPKPSAEFPGPTLTPTMTAVVETPEPTPTAAVPLQPTETFAATHTATNTSAINTTPPAAPLSMPPLLVTDKPTVPPAPKPTPSPTPVSNASTCRFTIRCDTIFNNMSMFNKKKLPVLPADGVILAETRVLLTENSKENALDLLKRITRENKIHMDFTGDYISGIGNLYEFDCGPISGWICRVNGMVLSYGSSGYTVQPGDLIEWLYTCDLGRDVGADFK